MFMFCSVFKPVSFAKTFLNEHESPVVPHLAYDLKELLDLQRKGKPISNASLESMYYEGSPKAHDVPAQYIRGVDINVLWNKSMDVKERLSKAQIRSVEIN